MARRLTDYRDAMLELLPRGAAWPRAADSDWGKLFLGLAEEFARIGAVNGQLLKEMNPATVVDLLPEWEADFNLPAPCVTEPQTFTQRRKALVSKYKLVGHQSQAFFIAVAAELGFSITITEYDNTHPGPQTEYQGVSLEGDDWNYVWQVNAPATSEQRRVSGSVFGESYTVYGNTLLECSLRLLAHDHRLLFFVYGSHDGLSE